MTVAIAIIGFNAFAQAEMRFEVETYDFGTITEGTIADYEFIFTNKGNAPIVLSSVNASCGCTTPQWTREPVLPNQKGTIKASYNSNGRPGFFNKSITVTSNAGTPTKVLFIKGNVVKKEERKIYSPEELAASPAIIIKSNTYSFGKVEKGQRVLSKFEIKNTGKSELKLINIESGCQCVSHRLQPSILKPGESGSLELYYQPRTTGDLTEQVKILSNDITQAAPTITLKAEVVESLSNQSLMKNKNDNPFK